MTQIRSYTVYPGEYTPLPEVETFLEELKGQHQNPSGQLPVNMNEFEDCYKIVVVVPGVACEDFCIRSHQNILSIAVRYKEANLENGMPQIHEFDYTSVNRDVLLPPNADIEFVTAEYTLGRLLVRIPKTSKPSVVTVKQIVVY